MIEFSGSGILLDIEGTTSSVSFVYDVMFPFARRELDAFLEKHWGQASVDGVCEQVADDAGHDSFAIWCAENASVAPKDLLRDEVVRLMDGDAKVTGLKSLQGLIWRSGFESGELRGHVYPDVVPAIDAWRANGCDVRVYSSGSVTAQKLFFGYSQAGDLLDRFSGHYDTTIGPKKDAASYSRIGEDFGLAAADILFLSDVVAELDAAALSGMATALCLRPGNAAAAADQAHPTIESFAEIGSC